MSERVYEPYNDDDLRIIWESRSKSLREGKLRATIDTLGEGKTQLQAILEATQTGKANAISERDTARADADVFRMAHEVRRSRVSDAIAVLREHCVLRPDCNNIGDAVEDACSLINRLHGKIAELAEAVGLATTAVPTMEIDVGDPVGMMQQVVKICAAADRSTLVLEESETDRVIDTLREQNEELEALVEIHRPFREEIAELKAKYSDLLLRAGALQEWKDHAQSELRRMQPDLQKAYDLTKELDDRAKADKEGG